LQRLHPAYVLSQGRKTCPFGPGRRAPALVPGLAGLITYLKDGPGPQRHPGAYYARPLNYRP